MDLEMITPSAYSLNNCLSPPSMDRSRALDIGCSGLQVSKQQDVMLKLCTASNNQISMSQTYLKDFIIYRGRNKKNILMKVTD